METMSRRNGIFQAVLLCGAVALFAATSAAAGIITLAPNARVRAGLDQEQWRQRFEAVRQPLAKLEAYIDKGSFLDKGRVRELEQHREQLRASLEKLEAQANHAGVPRGWRR